jgi:hypothetical protein
MKRDFLGFKDFRDFVKSCFGGVCKAAERVLNHFRGKRNLASVLFITFILFIHNSVVLLRENPLCLCGKNPQTTHKINTLPEIVQSKQTDYELGQQRLKQIHAPVGQNNFL